MKELLFVSGFLGSGKTTFLKEFIKSNRDKKISVIVNEFGKTGVDGTIIEELKVQVNEISNGSVLCSCKVDKFIEVLKNVLNLEYDLIIVESSGFTDPSNLKNIISNLNLQKRIEFLGDICIVDATRFLKLCNTAIVIEKQIKSADIILINKCNEVSTNIISEIKAYIKNINCYSRIYESNFGKCDNIIFENRVSIEEIQKESVFQSADLTLKKYNIIIEDVDNIVKIEEMVKSFIHESDRVKGFVKCKESIYYIDCVGEEYKCTKYYGEVSLDLQNNITVLGRHGLKTNAKIKEAKIKYDFIKK